MAKYTTEVRSICETFAGYNKSQGYSSVKEIISKSRSKIFDFEYPIFDALYKPVLETKILKHYYGREIGSETVGRWQLWLDTRMNEIMPYYNKLYETELLKFDPLRDIDITKDHSGEKQRTDDLKKNTTIEDDLMTTSTDSGSDNVTRTVEEGGTESTDINVEEGGNEGTTSISANSGTDTRHNTKQDSGTEGDSGSDVKKNTRWDTFSDTPQGALTNVANETYLTNARKIVDDGTGSTFSNTKTFGKLVTENDSLTHGLTNTTDTNTDFGKTVNNDETTTFGKTVDVDETSSYGKVNETAHSGTRTNEETANNEINTTDQYIEHIYGKTSGKSYSELLEEYRNTFLNIDLMVIKDLGDLFMGLW